MIIRAEVSKLCISIEERTIRDSLVSLFIPYVCHEPVLVKRSGGFHEKTIENNTEKTESAPV